MRFAEFGPVIQAAIALHCKASVRQPVLIIGKLDWIGFATGKPRPAGNVFASVPMDKGRQGMFLVFGVKLVTVFHFHRAASVSQQVSVVKPC